MGPTLAVVRVPGICDIHAQLEGRLGDARAAIDALAQLRIEVMRATPAQEQEGDVAVTMSFQPDVSDDAAVFGFAEDVMPPAALRLHIRSDLLRKLGLDAETRAGAVVAAGAAHSQAQATPVLTVRLVPVLFAQGINEMQSLADTGWVSRAHFACRPLVTPQCRHTTGFCFYLLSR